MSDYTPTTAKMFEAYYNYLRHTSRTSRDADAEFDRWLAEVKAQAWEEGYIIGISTAWQGVENEISNPYRQGEEQ